MPPYQYWLDNCFKKFALQFNLLRPTVYVLEEVESDPFFLSIARNAKHRMTYTKFLQHEIHKTRFSLITNTLRFLQ